MSDERPDRRVKHIGFTQRFLVVLPKNSQSEIRIAAKEAVTRGRNETQKFIDVREWWYKNGDQSREATASRRGTQVPRRHSGRMVEAILTELQPGEITLERIKSIRDQLDRLADEAD